jgi:hypothetical protein
LNLLRAPGKILFSLGKQATRLAALLAVTSALCLEAAPLDELRSLSLFPRLDGASLERGEIRVERGALGDFPRGIYLEACYFIHAPIEVVGDSLLHWDPVAHKDSDVRLYREFSLPPTADVFQSLQLSRARAGDQWLLEEAARVAQGGDSQDSHLTKEEKEIIRRDAKNPNLAWREILRRRSETLSERGLSAVAPYRSEEPISPDSEFRGLLTLAPKAAQHFAPITGAHPLTANGKAADETVGYWEASRVRNHTTLQLGIFAAQKKADSWQMIDCLYYPSDTYFMSLNLYQLWAMDGGTLVWQVGFVSAPFRSYLGGIDRVVAGKQMTAETVDTIKAFRRDLEHRR